MLYKNSLVLRKCIFTVFACGNLFIICYLSLYFTFIISEVKRKYFRESYNPKLSQSSYKIWMWHALQSITDFEENICSKVHCIISFSCSVILSCLHLLPCPAGVGDFVEEDEVVGEIETDKVRLTWQSFIKYTIPYGSISIVLVSPWNSGGVVYL